MNYNIYASPWRYAEPPYDPADLEADAFEAWLEAERGRLFEEFRREVAEAQADAAAETAYQRQLDREERYGY